MSTFDCLVTLYDTVVYDVNKYVEYITLRNYLNLQQKYSNQFMYLQFKELDYLLWISPFSHDLGLTKQWNGASWKQDLTYDLWTV